MACNCGKNKRQTPAPTGGKAPEVRQASQPTNKNAGLTKHAQSFELRTNSGQRQVFGSRLEAQAARRRAGGGTINPR